MPSRLSETIRRAALETVREDRRRAEEAHGNELRASDGRALLDLIARARAFVASAGVQPGDRVAVLVDAADHLCCRPGGGAILTATERPPPGGCAMGRALRGLEEAEPPTPRPAPRSATASS